MFEVELAQRRKKLLKALKGDPKKLLVLGLGLILVFLIVLYLGPLEGLKQFGLITQKKESARAESLTRPQIDIGVDAYTKDIPSQPSGLTFVYKNITPGNSNVTPTYIQVAYTYNLKPVLVVYTNNDSTTVDWPTWDATMNAIKADGREVWVVVEPDLLGMIRNNKTCGTVGKADIDRFLSTKPSNAHLGLLLSGWNLGDGNQKWSWSPSQEAIEWKACLTSAGGDRIEDVYFDFSDRDQEFRNTYPWPQSRITMWETFAKELSGQLGKKVGIWQIPMGNSQCQNGRRSNIVETWLTSVKLNELSPYVNRLLFGPGVEDSVNAQSWNLSTYTKYDCGLFNQKVTNLYGSVPTPTPTPTPKPKSPPCYFTDSNGNQRGYGDVNADGWIDNTDLGLVMSSNLTVDQKKAADVNGDKLLNVGDLLLMAKYLQNMIGTFPVCPVPTPSP